MRTRKCCSKRSVYYTFSELLEKAFFLKLTSFCSGLFYIKKYTHTSKYMIFLKINTYEFEIMDTSKYKKYT